MESVESVHREADRGRISIPDVIIGNALGSAKQAAGYAEAKSGSLEAAVRVSLELINDDLVEAVLLTSGNKKPIIQPVHAIEATGKNVIPHAAAKLLAMRTGHDVGIGIVQASSPKRTSMAGLERIFSRPVFFGQVEAGRDYILLDDTLTQGGTFAALHRHIVEGGGHVIGAVALTGKQYGARLQLREETLTDLRKLYGDIEDSFRAQTGYGYEQLTESEARYLARFNPSSAVRDRILNGPSPEGRQAPGRDHPQEVTSTPAPTPSTSHEAIAGRIIASLSLPTNNKAALPRPR